MGVSMEGVPVLITDSNEGLCFPIVEFLSEKRSLPFVLVKDFEAVPEISENFEQAIPIVLNIRQNVESTIDHLSALPSLACIFNFDGDIFENLFRQTFDHFSRTITIYKVDFDIGQVHTDILEAISEGYTLIINLIPLPLAGTSLLGAAEPRSVGGLLAPNMAQEQLVILEKLFLRKAQPLPLPQSVPKSKSSKASQNSGKKGTQKLVPVKRATPSGSMNPISLLFKKWFARFNPCAATPILDFLPKHHHHYRLGYCPAMMEPGGGIKSPQEINKYIRIQQSTEIRQSFRVIHESARKNWEKTCEENFHFTMEHQVQFERICLEIQRKAEEGRRSLMEKVNKDIERTRQYDHVLGELAIERIRADRIRDVNLKVQQFIQRKMLEAKEKIDEDIRQNKVRGKARFHMEILDEQVMELMRIKEKYRKRMDLLMLPYTGELSILKKN